MTDREFNISMHNWLKLSDRIYIERFEPFFNFFMPCTGGKVPEPVTEKLLVEFETVATKLMPPEPHYAEWEKHIIDEFRRNLLEHVARCLTADVRIVKVSDGSIVFEASVACNPSYRQLESDVADKIEEISILKNCNSVLNKKNADLLNEKVNISVELSRLKAGVALTHEAKMEIALDNWWGLRAEKNDMR